MPASRLGKTGALRCMPISSWRVEVAGGSHGTLSARAHVIRAGKRYAARSEILLKGWHPVRDGYASGPASGRLRLAGQRGS